MSSPDIRAALERLVELEDAKGPAPAIANAWTDAIAAARAALAAKPVGEGAILHWTDNAPPSEDCRYDHCTAETPFGRFLISWKSWKQFDSPTVDETPWGDWYGAFDSVDEAKAACQEGMDKRLARWGHPVASTAPGEVGELVAELELMASHAAAACQFGDAKYLSDAATLLAQQAAPAPAVVPVAVEALTRLYWWGGMSGSYGYSADVVLGVRDWINGGMTGGLPPLPAWVADRCPPLPQAGEVKGTVQTVQEGI